MAVLPRLEPELTRRQVGQGDLASRGRKFRAACAFRPNVAAQRFFRLARDFEKRSATPFYEIRAQGRESQSGATSDAKNDARRENESRTRLVFLRGSSRGWSAIRQKNSGVRIQKRSALITSFQSDARINILTPGFWILDSRNFMNCVEAQNDFSSYLDDQLTPPERATLDAHLAVCPVCRAQLAETRRILRRLAQIPRPAPPPQMIASISDAIRTERAARIARPAAQTNSRGVWGWLQPRLLPYTIGAFASMLLFFAVSSALRPHFAVLKSLALAASSGETSPNDVMWIRNSTLTPEDLAAGRFYISNESPTLNPRGALAAFASEPPSPYSTHKHRDAPDADDMVFVADVYANGSATLAEVVQAPRDRRMIAELQEALRKTPAFVPASLDKRPDTMRVVFTLQRVNVEERSF